MEDKNSAKMNSFFRTLIGKDRSEMTQMVIDFILMTNPKNRAALLDFLNEYAKLTGNFDLVKNAMKVYIRIEKGEDKRKAIEAEFGELSGHKSEESPDYFTSLEKTKKRITEMIEDKKIEKSLQRFSRPQVDYIDFLLSDNVTSVDESFIRIKHYANLIIEYGEDTEFAKEHLGLSDSEITQAKLWRELYFISIKKEREDADFDER